MSMFLSLSMTAAAALFITLSAMMNALFLSSLGRTPLETCILAVVSIASDMTKAALPVVIVRTYQLRAWSHLAAAATLLLFVILLSLASGTGFAALTRGAATAAREARTDERVGRMRELRDVEARLDRLGSVRPVSVIDAEIAIAVVDRRWGLSKSCSEISGGAARQFCTDVLKLRAERMVALERDRLASQHSATLASIAGLESFASGIDGDPQAAAIAQLLGVDTATPRRVLTTFMAIVIELGSVILVLLVAGPALLRWQEPGSEPKPPAVPASLPHSKDVSHWHRRRDLSKFALNRDEANAG